MRNRTLTLIFSSIVLTVIHPVWAEGQPTLTAEQLRHEKEMADLRNQKEILELKHSQALLLSECRDMGIDCQGNNLEITEKEHADALTAELDGFAEPTGGSPAAPSPFTFNAITPSSNSPVLEAIQNESAKFNLAGDSQWALVGDKVGDWVVTHIDATKVRIKNSSNAYSKTLVLNW